ncbi:pyridoxal 5'-phosphate synthase glutaminase subunit PdxT [Citricoccus nitrophenolicus]|uniref:Pyridoxal 5'-phosphate synthase subunit PdxT n=1 Tax=Citricoccus muralis TaxID=169134 RepID=A0A3D9LGD2_9MICC|nr:pyridoxal 5'-phosphate synthase glutaminase subunit PdxT [Citricoccus muralis]REE04900.1 pyridoxal phosphate synthase yaaE subunit [Citricoccus muralis]
MTAGPASVGVFALQGDVAEHVRVLTALGASVRPVRSAADLTGLDGLVIPGGESSVMDKLSRLLGVAPAIRQAIGEGLPVYGTCAGMIMLAESIANPIAGQQSFGGLNITVQRNAFGSQVESFETALEVPEVSGDPVHAVFIRAPAVLRAETDVQVLASVPASCLENPENPAGDIPVAVRQGRLLATSFHPEVTGDWSFHRYFLEHVIH